MTKLAILLTFLSATAIAQQYDTIPVLKDHYNQKLAQFKKQKSSTGHILFLGNSITEMGNFTKLLGDTTVINRGISGDVSFGVINRLDEVTRFQPSKVFLLIGINDLSKNIPENVILQNIFTIVNLIRSKSPRTVVYVHSELPVNPTVKNFPKGYDVNDKVVIINRELYNMRDRAKYTFIDIHKGFTDAEGLMDKKYTTDGLHLNAAGYERWIKILKENKAL